jgi:hypothetical protein
VLAFLRDLLFFRLGLVTHFLHTTFPSTPETLTAAEG